MGDCFKIRVVRDRFDYGLVEAMVTHVDGMGRVATLATHVRRDLDGPFVRVEVTASTMILERIKDGILPNAIVGIYPSQEKEFGR